MSRVHLSRAVIPRLTKDTYELEVLESVPVDDQFSSPRQCNYSAALGKLLVANASGNSAHLRDVGLAFYTKFLLNGILTIDSDANNIYTATSTYLHKRGFSTYSILSSLALASPRMIDASGDPDYVYVTSNNAADGHGVRKVRKSDMTVVASLLATGSGDGQFNNPLGVKKYGDYVYVADYSNNRVQKLNASDLSYVAQYPVTGIYDLDTDGTYWYYVIVGGYIVKRDMVFTSPSVASALCNAYSITIIPDQGDGNGQTLAITDDANSHIARYKCSDLTQVGSDVGSSGDGSSSLFDPTFTTSVSTTITYQSDDGITYTTPAGTSHALSMNGFAAAFHKTAGPHRWIVRCAAGMDKITSCDCNTDALCGKLVDFRKMTRLQSLYLYSNPLLTGDLSSLSAMTGMQSLSLYSDPLLTGDLSSLSAMTGMQSLSLYSDPRLTGDLSSLSAMTGMQSLYLSSDSSIGPASVATLVAIKDLRIYDMGWLAASVDTVLLSISDAIHADVNHFTYATPSLQIGGTNEAPGGTAAAATTSPLVTPGSGNSDSDWLWDAGAGKHKALTGMAAIYIMRNNTGHVWTVTATGVA